MELPCFENQSTWVYHTHTRTIYQKKWSTGSSGMLVATAVLALEAAALWPTECCSVCHSLCGVYARNGSRKQPRYQREKSRTWGEMTWLGLPQSTQVGSANGSKSIHMLYSTCFKLQRISWCTKDSHNDCSEQCIKEASLSNLPGKILSWNKPR